MIPLPDDITASGTTAIPSLFNLSGHSFLTGIHCRELPESYTTIDDELASLVSAYLNTLVITWDCIKVATASDTNMVQLISIIESGFPKFHHELPQALREYHQFHDRMYTVDGKIPYKAHTVIPPSLCQHACILTALHSAHQGVTSMTAHAETTVFWPGLTPAITTKQTNCHHCNPTCMVPSQPNAPPFPPLLPVYPFQCISAYFFHFKGKNYLVETQVGSKGLIDCLRRIFGTFGICATDGDPEFTASVTCQFLKDWRVHRRLSSVDYPHSNCRTEIGIKTVKCLITNNTDPNGSLNTDALQQAILQYQLSPAQCVFGSPIKDFIPILPGRYISQPTWSDNLAAREESLRNRHMKEAEQWRVQTGVYHLLQLATTYVFKARQVHIPTSGTRQASSLRSANLTNMSYVSMDPVESPFATASS